MRGSVAATGDCGAGAQPQQQLEPLVQMDGVEYDRFAFHPPFIVHPPPRDEWLLYLVRSGGITFRTADMAPGGDRLEKNTIIGMSGTIAHSFAVDATGKHRLCRWAPLSRSSEAPPDAVVISLGHVSQTKIPFITASDFIVKIDPVYETELVKRIVSLVDWIEDEQRRLGIESRGIVRRLAEVITLEIGRFETSRSAIFGDRRLQASKGDPRIWRAISAFTSTPEDHWTVERMAEVANMSRTSFAVHYRAMVGTTPLKSLRQLRMQRAASALMSPNASAVAELAAAMGYGSDAAFCRAFAKEFGHPPRRYGRQAAGDNAQLF